MLNCVFLAGVGSCSGLVSLVLSRRSLFQYDFLFLLVGFGHVTVFVSIFPPYTGVSAFFEGYSMMISAGLGSGSPFLFRSFFSLFLYLL